MAPRDGDVIEEDVGVRVAARRRGVRVQQEAGAAFGPLWATSRAEPVRQRLDGGTLLSGKLAARWWVRRATGVRLIDVVSEAFTAPAP